MFLVARRFLLALPIGLCGVAPTAIADDGRFAQAAERYRAGQWQQACTAFAELLASDPRGAGSGEARYYYGEALVQLGRWNEARTQFAQLLQNDPAGPHARGALFRAGEAAYMVGDHPAAGKDLHAFHRRYPDDPLNAYVLPYLGSLELQAGDAAASEQFFSQAATRFPSGPLAAEAQFGWAQALHKAGSLEQARQRYRAVIESGGPLAEPALLQLGTAENALDDYAAAVATFDQLASRFPTSALADKGRLGRGYALYKLDRHREAIEALAAISVDSPQHTEAAYWLALSQKGEKRWQAAVETLRGIDHDTRHRLAPAIAFHTADALLRDEQLPEAKRAFQQALDQFPDSPWADDALLGQLHIAVEQEDHKESIRLAGELIERFPDSPLVAQATLAKGQALVALDKPGDAVALLTTLADGDDTSDLEIRTRSRAALAVCNAKLGNFDQAREVLRTLSDTGGAEELASETTYQVAELALESGQEVLAQQLFASVAASDGQAHVATRAKSGLAWSHFQAGRWQEAAEAFGELLDSNPHESLAAEAALLRARSLENLEQFEPALAMYRRVIEQHRSSPRAAEALAGTGRLLEKLGRVDGARSDYARLIEEYPSFSELDVALYRYAWLLRADDPAAAERQFERLRNEFPQSQFVADATLRLAESAFDRQEYDHTERLLSEVADIDPPDAIREQALYLRGRLEVARGNWLPAITSLEQLIAEFPDDELALSSSYLIAEAQFRQGNYEQAVERLAALAAKTPERNDNWLARAEMRRAQALAHLRRWSEALEVARAISTRFVDFDQQYEVDYTIGRALAAQADFDGARQWYEQVIASPTGGRTETAAMAQWMLGESYFHQENYAAALAEYPRVSDRYPRWHAAALLQAGKCAEALGQWQSAVGYYEQLLAKYPADKLSGEATRRLNAASGRAASSPAELK